MTISKLIVRSLIAMNSLWEAAKRSPFLTSAHCEAKMTTDNQLVAGRNIAAAAAGNYYFSICFIKLYFNLHT